MRSKAFCSLGVAAALAATAALAGLPGASAAPASTSTTPTTTHYTGALADGATWIGDLPSNWNGVLVLYSHAFGSLSPADAPDSGTQAALLADGFALVGSSYAGPSLWTLNSATSDQFQALKAMEKITGRPYKVLALGTSMGGLVSAQEDQDGRGKIDGTLTTCGLVGGGVNLNNYQLDGEYAIAQLLTPTEQVQLVNYTSGSQVGTAISQLTTAVNAAQATAAGRARIALAAALLNTPDWIWGWGSTPPTNYAEQEAEEAAWLPGQLSFVISGRPQIEESAGGNASWNVGVNYGQLIRKSANYQQVVSLYQQAGLSLGVDTRNLTDNASIFPDVAALRRLTQSSVLTGHLSGPELTMHTISDQLSPIAYENYYRTVVAQAGDSSLLRQSFVQDIGHCNFTSSEIVAGLQTVLQRVVSGRWPSTTAAALNARATATGLGSTAFIDFAPPPFVNARSYWR